MIPWDEVQKLTQILVEYWDVDRALDAICDSYPDTQIWEIALEQARQARLRQAAEQALRAWHDAGADADADALADAMAALATAAAQAEPDE